MIQPSLIDKTPHQTITNLLQVAKAICEPTIIQIRHLARTDSLYFAKEIQKTAILRFFQFAIPDNEVSTMQSLIKAFSLTGTYDSIIALGKSIFGAESSMVITVEAGEVSIKIMNGNRIFNRGVATKDQLAVASQNDEWICALDYEEMNNDSIDHLFRQFLPVGVHYTLHVNNVKII